MLWGRTKANLRPEMGVFELFTTISMTSETGEARLLVRGDDPGLPIEAVLLGANEKNLEDGKDIE